MSALLAGLAPQEPDKIIGLMAQFAADPRTDKVDMGVGVYRDAQGRTPVMAAIKAAEARLLEQQETKGYINFAGDADFHRALGNLVLDGAVPWDRIAALATTGGTGAVRQGLELVRQAKPDLTLWLPVPTWPNHPAIANAIGLKTRGFRYYDPASTALDRDGMFADLEQVRAGDVVLLHGCCHNPTGADMALQDWRDLSDLLARRGVVPLVDVAYLGFGAGPDADMAGLRLMAAALPEILIAVSGSKTFGTYRDRVGLLLALCASPTDREAAMGNLEALNRLAYSFPPDHGARAVTVVLTDTALRRAWADELLAMRLRIADMRGALADALRAQTGSDRFGFLGAQKGMFSLLGVTPAQVAALREHHGIYMVGDGRINLAGLHAASVPVVAKAIAQVLG
jgi:aromatic-amino-acid transaminase